MGEKMLDAWATSNVATVDRLHAALYSMGREDVAKKLQDAVEKQGDVVVRGLRNPGSNML